MSRSSSSLLAGWRHAVVDPAEVLPEPESGFNVGVSVSNSADLARLGLTETHLRMALGEVARATLIARGVLSYGGHLRSDGYTAFLVHECERYRSRDRPFTGYLPWSVHRALSSAELAGPRKDIGLLGRYVFLDPEGTPIDDPEQGRGEEGERVDAATTARSLTAARAHMTAQTDARLVLGGQRAGFQGRMPGVVEEAILSIRAGKPIFVAGGFGGAAGDIARTLDLDPDGWLSLPNRATDADLTELSAAAADAEWDPITNGLSVEQNRQLAVSYRASEIASLVVLGLTNLRRTT
jgi:SLOG cluster2